MGWEKVKKRRRRNKVRFYKEKMEQNKKIKRFLAFGTALALYIGVNTTDRPAEKVVKKE